MSVSKYIPISCDFHSLIEHYATVGTYCRIQFKSPLEEFITMDSIVIDMFSEDNEEFAKLSSGDVIRLDRIIRINNDAAPGFDEAYFGCDCG